MIKLGILTYHRAYNYGAFLQAYSLSKKIKEIYKDVDVKLINYFPFHEKIRYEIKMPLWTLKNQGFIPMMNLFRKYRMFRREWHRFDETKWSIISNKSSKLCKKIDKYFDIVVVGSDAVFNDFGFKDISPFYLYHIKKAIKFSYAASAHGLIYTNNDINKNNKLRKTFGEFKFLGLRDKHTEEFIKFNSNNSNIYHTCDPTVFLDVNSINVDSKMLLKKYELQEKKYIIIMVKHEKIGEIIKKNFGSNYMIISLINYNRYANKSLTEVSPFEWSTIISKSIFTVSEYFHGILLSFRNGIPSICIDPMSNSNDFETKIYDFVVNRMSLNDLYFKYNEYDSIKEAIIKKGEEFIANNFRNTIISKMDVEANSFKHFLEILSQYIG